MNRNYCFGSFCNIEEILDLAKDNNLKVIEDCAHAVGTFHKSKHVGTIGNTGCFSSVSYTHLTLPTNREV